MHIFSNTHPYVYRLDNPITGEFYIGYRTGNKVPAEQDLGHKYFTSSKYVKPRFFQFQFQVIAEFFDVDAAYTFEQELIFESWGHDGLMNRSHRHGKGAFRLIGHSTETRHNMSKSNSRGPRSEETKMKQSATQKGKKRGPMSEENKMKISAANTGRIMSDETKMKISAANTGQKLGPRSDETKKKLSEAKKGTKLSAEIRHKRLEVRTAAFTLPNKD